MLGQASHPAGDHDRFAGNATSWLVKEFPSLRVGLQKRCYALAERGVAAALAIEEACHCNMTSRQTPARCQRYLWSRHRQRKCRTIRSSRPNSAGHFVTDDRAHGGFVVFGSFTFCMAVIDPGNRSRERKSHGPTGRHWIGLNGAVVFNRREAWRGSNTSLPFRGLEVHRYPHGLAPRGRKGRWDTVPSLVRALMTEVNCGGSGLRNSALVALLGFRPLSAGALPHWAGAGHRTGRTSRSRPAQLRPLSGWSERRGERCSLSSRVAGTHAHGQALTRPVFTTCALSSRPRICSACRPSSSIRTGSIPVRTPISSNIATRSSVQAFPVRPMIFG